MSEELNRFEELYPGRFIKALGPETEGGRKKPVFTISNVLADKLEGRNGPERKIIVTFKETRLAWVLSKINGVALKTMWGGNVNDWIGKRVCLYATDQIAPFPSAKGDDRFCLRVYGSPDIAGDVVYEFQMPRKKEPLRITLYGPKKGKPAQPAATDTNTEEFFEPPQAEGAL